MVDGVGAVADTPGLHQAGESHHVSSLQERDAVKYDSLLKQWAEWDLYLTQHSVGLMIALMTIAMIASVTETESGI